MVTTWLKALFLLVICAQTWSAHQIIPPLDKNYSEEAPVMAAILVPGGKVPSNNYTLVAKAIQANADSRLWIGIPECPVNLCDPLDSMTSFGLQKIADEVIGNLNKSAGGSLRRSDIYIIGHSLGGVGARYFFEENPGYAGLSIFGTQFIGDHLDYQGTLGLPTNLSAFRAPFLSLIGELDMIPFTHAARLLSQRDLLPTLEQSRKIIAVIPGLDHSDFCQGFNVSGDIKSELSPQTALEKIGAIVGAWMNLQLYTPKSSGWMQASRYIEDFTEQYTRPLMSPFLEALKIEETSFCAEAQQIISNFPEAELGKLNISQVTVNSLINLMHLHGNITYDGIANTSTLSVPGFASYDENNNFNYAPKYSGSSEIACKTMSSEKIFATFNLSTSSSQKQATCKDVNRHSWNVAQKLISKHWPKALERYLSQGKKVKFEEDQASYMGPQWVFLSHLNFNEQTGSISGASLYTSLNSFIFSGNYYCKVLSPSKAVEFIMVTSLTERYT